MHGPPTESLSENIPPHGHAASSPPPSLLSPLKPRVLMTQPSPSTAGSGAPSGPADTANSSPWSSIKMAHGSWPFGAGGSPHGSPARSRPGLSSVPEKRAAKSLASTDSPSRLHCSSLVNSPSGGMIFGSSASGDLFSSMSLLESAPASSPAAAAAAAAAAGGGEPKDLCLIAAGPASCPGGGLMAEQPPSAPLLGPLDAGDWDPWQPGPPSACSSSSPLPGSGPDPDAGTDAVVVTLRSFGLYSSQMGPSRMSSLNVAGSAGRPGPRYVTGSRVAGRYHHQPGATPTHAVSFAPQRVPFTPTAPNSPALGGRVVATPIPVSPHASRSPSVGLRSPTAPHSVPASHVEGSPSTGASPSLPPARDSGARVVTFSGQQPWAPPALGAGRPGAPLSSPPPIGGPGQPGTPTLSPSTSRPMDLDLQAGDAAMGQAAASSEAPPRPTGIFTSVTFLGPGGSTTGTSGPGAEQSFGFTSGAWPLAAESAPSLDHLPIELPAWSLAPSASSSTSSLPGAAGFSLSSSFSFDDPSPASNSESPAHAFEPPGAAAFTSFLSPRSATREGPPFPQGPTFVPLTTPHDRTPGPGAAPLAGPASIDGTTIVRPSSPGGAADGRLFLDASPSLQLWRHQPAGSATAEGGLLAQTPRPGSARALCSRGLALLCTPAPAGTPASPDSMRLRAPLILDTPATSTTDRARSRRCRRPSPRHEAILLRQVAKARMRAGRPPAAASPSRYHSPMLAVEQPALGVADIVALLRAGAVATSLTLLLGLTLATVPGAGAPARAAEIQELVELTALAQPLMSPAAGDGPASARPADTPIRSGHVRRACVHARRLFQEARQQDLLPQALPGHAANAEAAWVLLCLVQAFLLRRPLLALRVLNGAPAEAMSPPARALVFDAAVGVLLAQYRGLHHETSKPVLDAHFWQIIGRYSDEPDRPALTPSSLPRSGPETGAEAGAASEEGPPPGKHF